MSETVSPQLSPADCADVLGVSPDYIVGEIKEGRLPARERTYDSGRKRYRVDAGDFAAYVAEYWPRKERRAAPRAKVS